MGAYLFCNTDDVIGKSSSGGGFSAVVDTVREQGKTVLFGAAFDADMNVIHRKFPADGDYSPLRGSKYCFSTYAGALSEAAEALRGGEQVIFTGTPCQIFALKARLEKESIPSDRLMTIDLICHGAPDQKLWAAYRHWLEQRHHSKLTDFRFRFKGAKWHGYSMMAEFESGERIVNSHDLQVYMDLYFTHQVMRESCYHCPFASPRRQGDITLGDFWGAESVFPDIVSHAMKRQGISLILANTEKGTRVLSRMEALSRERGWLMKKCETDAYMNFQSGLNAPVELPGGNDAFRAYLRAQGFNKAVRKYAGFNLKGALRYQVKYLANALGLIR